jgi:ABC-2 type transport system permease protein
VSGQRSPGLRRFAALTYSLAITDFKLRYYGNVLGYFWTLAKPLMLFGVIYVAFTQILHIGNQVPHYAAYLITALVLFSYFAEVTGESVGSLVANEPLLRKLPLPMLAIPLSIALRGLLTLGLNLVAVLVFLLISGVPVTIDWLQFPLLVVALVMLATGVSALLASLYVSFRDTAPIWEVLSQVIFWGTPIFYTIQQVPQNVRELVMLNPLAMIMTQMRHSLIDQSAPSAIGAVGAAPRLAIPIAIILAALVGGLAFYRRVSPTLVERL